MMPDDPILCVKDGAVATVTFNRPEKLNAFTHGMYQALHTLLEALESESVIRVVIITGRGRGFCAGEDLAELERLSEQGLNRADFSAALDRLQSITRIVATSAKIYIAAVNGVAAGFGAELAVACDIRYASTSAHMLFPEVRRGLFVTNGVTHLLPRIVGLGRALELLLTGTPIDADIAERMGIFNRVCPDAELLRTAQTLAVAIAANEAMAVRLTKRALREGVQGDLEGALQREIEFALACADAGAHLEGARAFLEKRAPSFTREHEG
jgi:enoyl-CoA hydratase/carnithine racemase